MDGHARYLPTFLHSTSLSELDPGLLRLSPGRTVLEVGPSHGAVTAQLQQDDHPCLASAPRTAR